MIRFEDMIKEWDQKELAIYTEDHKSLNKIQMQMVVVLINNFHGLFFRK